MTRPIRLTPSLREKVWGKKLLSPWFPDAERPTGESTPVTVRGTVVPAHDQVRELAERLNAARTVTLFCGAGVRGAHAEVMALAGRLQSPVGHSLRGKEWIQYDNPYDVGMSGLLGYGACYDATHQADLLLLLGTDFPYDAFLPQRRTIQVDHDLTRLGRRTLRFARCCRL